MDDDTPARRLRRLFAFRRGILGLDTEPAVLAGRFHAASVPTGRRAAYLAMLAGTPGLASRVNAVVLSPSEFEPTRAAGPIAHTLRRAGLLTGGRADTGTEPISGDGRDRVTSGLDGLADQLRRLAGAGAGFAVWSTVAGSDVDGRGLRVLTVNSQAAARFGVICQDLGLIPMVRVGIRVPTGTTPCGPAVLAAALLSVTGHLEDLGVDLGTVVICTRPGPNPDHDPHGVGPLAALPNRLGGLALARAADRPEVASAALAMVAAGPAPWPVTFYLGREVTEPALRAWGGIRGSVGAGRRAFASELAEAAAALSAQDPGAGPAEPIPAARSGRPGLCSVPAVPR